jgi:hypothetical protein
VSVWWGASVCGAMPCGVIYVSVCVWRGGVQDDNENRSSGSDSDGDSDGGSQQ